MFTGLNCARLKGCIDWLKLCKIERVYLLTAPVQDWKGVFTDCICRRLKGRIYWQQLYKIEGMYFLIITVQDWEGIFTAAVQLCVFWLQLCKSTSTFVCWPQPWKNESIYLILKFVWVKGHVFYLPQLWSVCWKCIVPI